MKTYYEILGLPSSATEATIERAYKHALASLSDKKSDLDATKKRNELKHAYQILSNPDIRKIYDNILIDFNQQPIDPALRNVHGNSLLHLLVNEYVIRVSLSLDPEPLLAFIVELVTKYKFNTKITSADRQTLLQQVCADSFAAEDILENPKNLKFIIRLTLILKNLGAQDKDSFLATLLKQEKLLTTKDEKKFACSNYLQLLLILANERSHEKSASILKLSPIDINLMILGLLDSPGMNKTAAARIALAKEIFANTASIRQALRLPGGFNVYQSRHKLQNNYTFLFYKSAKILAQEFDELKANLIAREANERSLAGKKPKKTLSKSSQIKLDAFRQYAIDRLKEHISLFTQPADKQKLYSEIQATELYKPIIKKKS